MLHDTLDTRNLWCELLYESKNVISNADHRIGVARKYSHFVLLEAFFQTK